MYRIKPKKGLKVINPETLRGISSDGIVVPKITSYWKNRKSDGDVDITKVTTKKAQQKNDEKGK